MNPVGVDGPGGPVGQDLFAVLALDLHRLVLVDEGDMLGEVAPVVQREKRIFRIGLEHTC